MIGTACVIAKQEKSRFSTSDCPRCGHALVREMIDVNLLESKCACGYSARDREGSLAEADAAIREAEERYGRVVVRRTA